LSFQESMRFNFELPVFQTLFAQSILDKLHLQTLTTRDTLSVCSSRALR
jgi:hypothetical protein